TEQPVVRGPVRGVLLEGVLLQRCARSVAGAEGDDVTEQFGHVGLGAVVDLVEGRLEELFLVHVGPGRQRPPTAIAQAIQLPPPSFPRRFGMRALGGVRLGTAEDSVDPPPRLDDAWQGPALCAYAGGRGL